jgi:hypothetical protein
VQPVGEQGQRFQHVGFPVEVAAADHLAQIAITSRFGHEDGASPHAVHEPRADDVTHGQRPARLDELDGPRHAVRVGDGDAAVDLLAGGFRQGCRRVHAFKQAVPRMRSQRG